LLKTKIMGNEHGNKDWKSKVKPDNGKCPIVCNLKKCNFVNREEGICTF
jgi:hypothetical protein